MVVLRLVQFNQSGKIGFASRGNGGDMFRRVADVCRDGFIVDVMRK